MERGKLNGRKNWYSQRATILKVIRTTFKKKIILSIESPLEKHIYELYVVRAVIQNKKETEML